MKRLIFAILIITGCTPVRFRVGDCVAVSSTSQLGIITEINDDGSITIYEKDRKEYISREPEEIYELPRTWCEGIGDK